MGKAINAFFGDTPHRELFFRANGKVVVDIEYYDFMNEQHVKEELHKALGNGPLLAVKRNCSERMMKKIKESFGGSYSLDELFDRIESFEE